MAQIRKRADAKLDRVEQVWDRFKNLAVGDLEATQCSNASPSTPTASSSRARRGPRRTRNGWKTSTLGPELRFLGKRSAPPRGHANRGRRPLRHLRQGLDGCPGDQESTGNLRP